MEDSSKSFYIKYDDKNEDSTYSDKDFQEILINLIKIDTSCSMDCATFPSKSKLHNHLKNNYRKVASLSFPPKAIFSITIIASKAVHQFFGSWFVFRGWIYATVNMTLTPKHLLSDLNLKLIACLI